MCKLNAMWEEPGRRGEEEGQQWTWSSPPTTRTHLPTHLFIQDAKCFLYDLLNKFLAVPVGGFGGWLGAKGF